MLEITLKQIITEKKKQGVSKILILNYLKEYIQYLVLSLIYNHKKFKKLTFKGGSCLRICFNLPRLSENLDFDCSKSQFKGSLLKELKEYLSYEIKNKYFANLEIKIQSTKRLYLKFPFLHRLGLAEKSESDKLYVKIETAHQLLPCAKFESTPISKFGFNFIAYHYDLPSLMAGKINALLNKVWFKRKKQEIDIKGRDFYDLFWFLKNNVKPNFKTLEKTADIKNEKQLKEILSKRLKKVATPQKLAYDLRNFIPEQEFVNGFAKNYPEIIKKYLTHSSN